MWKDNATSSTWKSSVRAKGPASMAPSTSGMQVSSEGVEPGSTPKVWPSNITPSVPIIGVPAPRITRTSTQSSLTGSSTPESSTSSTSWPFWMLSWMRPSTAAASVASSAGTMPEKALSMPGTPFGSTRSAWPQPSSSPASLTWPSRSKPTVDWSSLRREKESEVKTVV